MDNTNQHYITKAHLDKFVHPESGQAILYPYRRGGGACKPRGTKRLGSAINFYRQRENGVLHDKLDEARKHSETLLFSSGKRSPSSLSTCIFDEGFIPTEKDRVHLAGAAAFLWCGSPVQIHNTAMHALLLHQMEFFNWLSTSAAIEEYRAIYGEAAVEQLSADREKVLDGDLYVDVGKENWKQLGFSSFQIEEGVIKLLLGMQMTIIDCHPRCFFISSDNPVIRTYPSSYKKQDDEVWFPISYKRGVLWHRRNLGTRSCFGYSENHVYNRRMISHSYKFSYSPLGHDWVAAASKQVSADPPLLGHYGSLRQVLDGARPSIDTEGRPGNDIVDLVAAMKSGPRVDVVGI